MTRAEKIKQLKKEGFTYVSGYGWYIGDDAYFGPDANNSRYCGDTETAFRDMMNERDNQQFIHQ